MPKTCIVTKENRRITSVRTFTGLRSKLYDKIASIPVMGNRDQAFSFFEKVYSKKFMDKFGDWTEESRIPAAMRELREEMDRQYEEGAVKLQYYTGEETGEILPRLIGEEGVRSAFNFALSPANQSPAYANERMEMVRGLYIARMAEKEGVPMRKIYRATGWQKDADGKWKYELPDNIELSNPVLRMIQNNTGKRDPIAFKELFKSGNAYLEDIAKEYPSILDLEIRIYKNSQDRGNLGAFKREGNKAWIEFNLGGLSNKESFTLTLIHEVQHFIQWKEGFERGGSTIAAEMHPVTKRERAEYQSELNEIRKQRQKLLSTEKFRSHKKVFDDYEKIRERMPDPYTTYTKGYLEYVKRMNKLYSVLHEKEERINSLMSEQTPDSDISNPNSEIIRLMNEVQSIKNDIAFFTDTEPLSKQKISTPKQRKAYREAREQVELLEAEEEFKELSDLRNREQVILDNLENLNFLNYKRIAGEAESRNEEIRYTKGLQGNREVNWLDTMDVLPSSRLYRTEGMLNTAETTANAMSEMLHAPINVVTRAQIEQSVGNQQLRQKMLASKGWYDPQSGEVFLVADNHLDEADVEQTILHETIAHKGLRELLGDQFDSTMRQIFSALPQADRNAYLQRYGDEVTAAEEYMARLGEQPIEMSVFRRIIAAIRKALRDLGIDLQMSDTDMMYLLLRSRENLTEMDKEIAKPTSSTGVVKGETYPETGEPRLFFRDAQDNLYDTYGEALRNENSQIEAGFTTAKIADNVELSQRENSVKLNNPDAFIPVMRFKVSTNPSTPQGAINYLIKKGYLHEEKVFDKDERTYRLTGKGRLSDNRIFNSVQSYYMLSNLLGQRNVEMNEDGLIRVSSRSRSEVRMMQNGKPVTVNKEEIMRRLEAGEFDALSREYENMDMFVVSLFFENADVFSTSPSFTPRNQQESQLRNRILDTLRSFGIRVVGMTDYIEKYGAKHGSNPSVKALADLANGVIAVAEGASLSDVAEEVAHFMVESYNDQAAVEEAMREVEGTEEWNTYASEYYMTYSRVYSGAELETAVRKEILGKILKNRILGENAPQNAFTRLIQGIQNFLRSMFTTQRSTIDRIMDDMHDAFLSGENTQFDTSLLAQSTFALYSTDSSSQSDNKDMYDLQNVIDGLKRTLRNLRQTRAEIASSVDTTLSQIQQIEQDMKNAEAGIETNGEKMAAASLLSSMEAQVAYIENLIEQTGKNKEFMKPSDRMNIQTVNNQMEPLVQQLRGYFKNTTRFDPSFKKALIKRADNVMARLNEANSDLQDVIRRTDEDFIKQFLGKFGISDTMQGRILDLVKGVFKDVSWLARMFGTLERSGNMINRALGAVIARNNLNAVTDSQAELQPMFERAQKEGWDVETVSRTIKRNPDGTYSSFLIDERDMARYDFERRVEQVKALRDIMNLKDLSDEQIDKIVSEGNPYEFKYDVQEGGKTVEKKFTFLPSNTRAVMDFLSVEEEARYRRRMSEWDSVHSERMFKDEYYKRQEEFYDKVEKFINGSKDPSDPTYVRISEETKTFLQNFYREKAIQMSKFLIKDDNGNITGFKAAEWRRSSSREAVEQLEKAKRQAESRYVYIGAERVEKTGSQKRLAEDLTHISNYYRQTESERRVTAQRFYDEVGKMMKERSGGQTSNEDIMNYITSGGKLSFSEAFWNSLPAYDTDGNQAFYRQIANAIKGKTVGDDAERAEKLATRIKAKMDSVRDIIRFNRDMTRPGNVDYSMMTKSEIEAIQELQEGISTDIRELYSLAGKNGVNVRQFQSREINAETDFNDSFEDAYQDYLAEKPENTKRWHFAERYMLLASRNKVNALHDKLSRGVNNKFAFTEAETRIVARALGISPQLESADFRRRVAQELGKLSEEEREQRIDRMMNEYAARFVYPYFRRTQPRGYGDFMRAANADPTFDWVGFLRAIENGGTFTAERQNGNKTENVSFDCSMLSFTPNKQAMDEEATFADMINPDYDTTKKYGMHQPKKSLYRDQDFYERFGEITTDKNGNRKAERNDGEFQMLETFKNLKRTSLTNYNAMGRYSFLEIPQMSQTQMERMGGLFTRTGKTLANWLKDKTMDRVDDSIYGNTVDGQESSEEDRVKIMPKYYLNRLENQSDVSHDLVNSYANLIYQSYLYKAKQDSLDDVMGLENMLLNHKFEGGKKASETNAYQMFKDYMDAYFFGIHSNTKRITKNIMGYQIDVTKTLRWIEGLMRMMNLALSPAVAFTGAVTGQINHLIEGYTGQYFDRDSMWFADKEMGRIMPDLINEIGDINRTSEFYLVGEQMGIFNMQSRMFGAGYNKALRMAFRDPLYKPMEILAYPLGPQTMIAVLDSFRFYNGRFMDKKEFMELNKDNANAESEWKALRSKSLWNQKRVENGKLRWDTSLFGNDSEAESKMKQAVLNARMRTRSAAQIINGQLNDENRLGATRHWALRFTTAHRGWLSLAAQRLWGRKGYNFQTQQFEEGLTVSLGHFMKKMYDASGQQGFLNLIGMYNSAKNGLNDYERQNLKRFMVYACIFGIFQFMSALLFGWRDDDENDDNWLVQFASYIGMRTINETASQMPLFFASNIVDIISDPFVMMNKLRDFTDLRNLSFDEVTSGTYKGSPYIWRTFCKNTFLKQLYNFRTADSISRSSEWWRQTNRATMGWFWGASRSRQSMDEINWWEQ